MKTKTYLWPLWVAVGFPLLLIALDATPLAPDFFFVMMGWPFLLLVWAGSGVWAAFLTVRALRKRAWRQAAIDLVLPLVILGVGLCFTGFARFCSNAGDTVHFYLRRPAYVKIVRATSPNGNVRLLVINMGGMSWASRGFAYDESDEILRESSTQSPGWKVRAQNSELVCGYGAVPVPGPLALTRHWYIASFAC
jgi:hypothetical protein